VLDAATKEQRRVAVDLMGYPTLAQRNKNEVIKCALPTCTNRLRGKQRMYCSNQHAAQHRNELKHAEARAIVESEVMGQIRETVAPVVREMLTERVLNELNVLVNAIPKAAQTIVQDLDDPDPDVHQKAATLLLKYTLGNSSIAPPPVGAQDSAPMQVFIGMPQQGAPAAVDSEATEVPEIEAVPQAPEQAEEPERECLECHLFKPPSEFVGASHRCNDCQKKLMDSVTERYPDLVRSVHASSESSPARIPSNP
jgi:hypothetical protein